MLSQEKRNATFQKNEKYLTANVNFQCQKSFLSVWNLLKKDDEYVKIEEEKSDSVKIVHLADLHIGRRFNDLSLIEDQRYIIDEILKSLDTIKPDVLILAGDIYDKANPSAEAFEVWNDFITHLSKRDMHVLIISGNHDSQERLGVGRALFEEHQIHLVSHYDGEITKVVLNDELGAINFYLIPYLKPSMVRNYHSDFEGTSFQDAFEYVMGKEKISNTERNVMIAHQFVIAKGALPKLSDSEIGPSVGGLDAIDASLFEGFDYVALGHIHRPQKIGNDTVRYAGSPLKYSFSESMHVKSMPIITLEDTVSIELLPLKPKRDVRVLKGTLDALFQVGKQASTQDFIHATLTDDLVQGDALNKLRSVFPNLVSMDFENSRTESQQSLARAETILDQKPFDLFNEFFQTLNGRSFNTEEAAVVHDVLEEIKEETR